MKSDRISLPQSNLIRLDDYRALRRPEARPRTASLPLQITALAVNTFKAAAGTVTTSFAAESPFLEPRRSCAAGV